MPDWDSIFSEHGKYFTKPHTDMKRIIKLFRETGVKRILDLGCGTGRHLVLLAKNDFEVYGFDSSAKALNLAEQWLVSEGLNAHIRLHRMEEPFPYPANFFGGLISIQVIHHNLMDDILKTAHEIKRVLRPTGIAFITFPVFHENSLEDDWALRKVEEGTYIPEQGMEAGIPHHYFSMDEIPTIFGAFDILDLYLDDTGHRCLVMRMKS